MKIGSSKVADIVSPLATEPVEQSTKKEALHAPPVPKSGYVSDQPIDLSAVNRIFRRDQGMEENTYVVTPQAQAQLVLDNQRDARTIVIAQPSGNVGAGLWWQSDDVTRLTVRSEPKPVQDGDLRGVQFDIEGDQAGELMLRLPILDSIRAIRDVIEIDPFDTATLDARASGIPPELTARDRIRQKGHAAGLVPDAAVRSTVVESESTPERIVIERTSISGNHRHRLVVEAVPGTRIEYNDQGISIRSDNKPRFRVTYETNLPPLTARAPLELLAPDVAKRLQQGDAKSVPSSVLRAAEDLTFLVYEEKAVAGGWRFLTYFGRDTLLTARIMAPFLAPHTIAAILRGALGALDDGGGVAHEPDETDQAEFARLQQALAGAQTPARERWSDTIYDYKMVDDDFLLTSLAAEHLDRLSAPESKAFLEQVNARGETNLRGLGRNLARVVSQALPYAQSVQQGSPDPTRMIRIRHDEQVGDWRDSNAGLGGGVYPSSINLDLVPTTLAKAYRLVKSLEESGHAVTEYAPELTKMLGEPPTADAIKRMAASWETARGHYRVNLDGHEVVERLRARRDASLTTEERLHFESCPVTKETTVGDVIARGSLPNDDGLSFSALSLDTNGKPVPVMSTDVVFGLIGSELREDALRELVELVSRPWPLGLASETGLLIANGALANDDAQFDRMLPGKYHGEVHWTWPPAHILAGLQSQRQAAKKAGRDDLVRLATEGLNATRRQVRACSKPELLGTELYSSKIDKNCQRVPIPFAPPGQKANTTQLWTTALPFWMWSDN